MSDSHEVFYFFYIQLTNQQEVAMRKIVLSLIVLMITGFWFAASGALAAEKGKIIHEVYLHY